MLETTNYKIHISIIISYNSEIDVITFNMYGYVHWKHTYNIELCNKFFHDFFVSDKYQMR